MKVLISVAFLILFFSTGSALDCYTYSANSYEGVPDDVVPSLSPCLNSNATMCVTLAWTTKLKHAGTVKFEQGLCSTLSVCQSFCTALNLDPDIGQDTDQCQQQCCSQSGCNLPRDQSFFHHNE